MPKWNQRKGDNGPIFLMDADERLVGVRDRRGADWHIPMVQATAPETEALSGPIAGTPGGGVSGSIATSSGSDITFATLDGDVISGYTAAIKYEIARTDGVPTAIDILDGAGEPIPGLSTTLARIGTTNNFTVTGGPTFVGGRLRMTYAQYISLMDNVPTADITPGFAVAVIGVGSMTDSAGTALAIDAWKSYLGGGQWCFDRPLNVINSQSVLHNGTGAESAPLRTLPAIPMRMLGKWDKISCMVWRQGTGNTGTKVGKLFLNGSGSTNRVMQLTMNASASGRAMPLKKEIFHRGTTSEFELFSFTNNGELTSTGTDSGIAQLAVNSATADLVFSYTETASVGDSVTLMQLAVSVSSEAPQLS